MDVPQVCQLLTSLSLGKYVNKFCQMGIRGKALSLYPAMEEAQELGIDNKRDAKILEDAVDRLLGKYYRDIS